MSAGINLPIGAVAFFGIFFFLRLPNRRTEGVLYKLKNLDWFGSITITAGTVLLLMGLTFGGQPIYGWGSPATISCLAIGVLFYPLFGIAEWKAKEPMVPLHLFRVRNFAITSASSFILGIAMFAPTYFIPLWFQIVRESSATNAGLAFLPGFIMSTIAGFTCGVLTTKYGIVLPFYRVGFAILALGMGLDSLWTGTMPYWQQAILLGLTGLGFGMVIVTIMLIVQTAVDGHEIGPATTVVSFLQTLGGIMGLAVLNVIIASQLNSRLPPKLDVIAAQYGIPHAVMEYVVAATLGGRPTDTLHPVAEFLPPGSPAFIATVAAMQDSTVHAFYIIFLVIGCVSVIPVILSAFLKKPNLSGGTLAVMDGQVMIQKDEEVNLDGVAAAEAPVNEKSNQ